MSKQAKRGIRLARRERRLSERELCVLALTDVVEEVHEQTKGRGPVWNALVKSVRRMTCRRVDLNEAMRHQFGVATFLFNYLHQVQAARRTAA